MPRSRRSTTRTRSRRSMRRSPRRPGKGFRRTEGSYRASSSSGEQHVETHVETVEDWLRRAKAYLSTYLAKLQEIEDPDPNVHTEVYLEPVSEDSDLWLLLSSIPREEGARGRGGHKAELVEGYVKLLNEVKEKLEKHRARLRPL